MIGQEVNSPAQKLLRSARRKRGALQGVKCLLAVIQASWVSHEAWPQIKTREDKTARMTQEQILEGSISPARVASGCRATYPKG
jgi:hypothetical protein